MGFIKNLFGKIGGGIKKAFNWIKDKAAPVVSNIWNKISPIAKPLVGLIPGIGPILSGGIHAAEKFAGPVMGIANGLINGNGRERMEAINKAGESILGRGGTKIGIPENNPRFKEGLRQRMAEMISGAKSPRVM
jgi:phage-related protein